MFRFIECHGIFGTFFNGKVDHSEDSLEKGWVTLWHLLWETTQLTGLKEFNSDMVETTLTLSLVLSIVFVQAFFHDPKTP